MTISSLPRLLAVSGSLRKHSVNTAVLEALAELAGTTAQVVVYRGLGELPHFNPDLDTDTPPAPVVSWRDEVAAAAGLFICTPEYAHGVPGVFKNALDWLVSDARFAGKPVALLNARPRATWSLASLRETLTVMSATVMESASVSLPLTSPALTQDKILGDHAVRGMLQRSLKEMLVSVGCSSP